jgi:Clp amino terminal domain, pathogenicity island component
MGYRGEDLDLRTPQTWSATPADLAGAGEFANPQNGPRGYRSGPIWVDETVLACSNHAFDVALAHRAGEVRLEHLLHALSRIDAAAEALEARGVRVAALRRDSATIIASDIPVGLPNGKGVPRRSEEFAQALRLAAASAARRNAPAGIEDLLNVLFDQRADFAASGLLQRNMARPVVRETAVEPLPPLTRYTAEPPRYQQAPLQIESRPIKPEPRYMPEPPRYVPEAPRYMPEPPRTVRTEYAATPVDTMQNNRIEALEQLVRNLSSDLASERQVVSGMLKDLSRETQAQRDDQGRMHSGLYDRLDTIERGVTDPGRGAPPVESLLERLQTIEGGLEARLNDMSRSWAVLSDRLQTLEHAVRDASDDTSISNEIVERISRAIDLKPIANRLDIIEEALLSHVPGGDGGVTDRLKSLEGEIARALASNTASTGRMESLLAGFERQRGDLAGQIAGPMIERFTALTSTNQNQQAAQYTAMSTAVSKMADRVDAVERAVAAEIETSAAKHQAYTKDLGEVHDALMKLNQNQHTLAGSIDQWRTEATGDLSAISNRLGSLNRDSEGPMQAINGLTAQMDNMSKTIIERNHRRHRLWYWLFGTDDWIGTSWPSQVASVEAERQRLKFAKRV